jgi:DNA processing protein
MPATDIKVIGEESEGYPPLLREIREAPKQLWVRGSIELLSHEPMLAVVGSRKASAYGKHCVKKLLTPLVQAGVPLVSGLAYGIDAAAHHLCVEHDQPTVAVLGSGVDDESIYPKVNIKLVHEIIAHGGAVISEYEPGTPPFLGHFPERNRIIAGLTMATLVVQAAQRSGSLITARLALESGRDVWAVPGALNDPLAFGTNELIKNGATSITSPDDVITLLGLDVAKSNAVRAPDLNTAQKKIYAVIAAEPIHVDEVAEATHLAAPVITAELLQLELAGMVINVGGMKYIKL